MQGTASLLASASFRGRRHQMADHSKPGSRCKLPHLLGLLLVFVCTFSGECPLPGASAATSRGARLRLYSSDHPAMGTTYSLYLYAASAAEADADAASVFDEIDRLEQLLSNYRKTSELSRINREAGSSDVTTDPETFHFLERSLGWSARSNGAFDLTVGKLMKSWGFFEHSGHRPTVAELTQVRRETGWTKVHLDAGLRTVHFLSPGIELDPGGIGKGYAVDQAIAILRSEHISAALLSAGSSTIYALGAPPGKEGWKIQVPALGDGKNVLSSVVLRDTALSTANCSEKHFIENHHMYCHIMDPHTLQPVEGMLQVTVIDSSATDSDALSNVLFVSNLEERTDLLQDLSRDSALILSGRLGSVHCEATRWKGSLSAYCRAPASRLKP